MRPTWRPHSLRFFLVCNGLARRLGVRVVFRKSCAGKTKTNPKTITTVPGTCSNQNAQLTNGPQLARNTAWNLLGNGAPMLVAVFCIPLLIKGLGTDRFGVLTLVWALIGYATLFDLGLGRALTQLIATKLGSGEDHEVPTLVWTSLLLMLLLGILGAMVVVLLAP